MIDLLAFVFPVVSLVLALALMSLTRTCPLRWLLGGYVFNSSVLAFFDLVQVTGLVDPADWIQARKLIARFITLLALLGCWWSFSKFPVKSVIPETPSQPTESTDA